MKILLLGKNGYVAKKFSYALRSLQLIGIGRDDHRPARDEGEHC